MRTFISAVALMQSWHTRQHQLWLRHGSWVIASSLCKKILQQVHHSQPVFRGSLIIPGLLMLNWAHLQQQQQLTKSASYISFVHSVESVVVMRCLRTNRENTALQ